MRAVFVVAHRNRPDAFALARHTITELRSQGARAWMSPIDAENGGDTALGDTASPSSADLVVCMGGDGTMLHTVSLLDDAMVPIVGVNMGRLGYLAELEPVELPAAIDRFFAGRRVGEWRLDERMMLDVVVRDPDGRTIATNTALNEAVVEKQMSGHTVHLEALIDGDPFTTYAADGLIVATPTGSTAYSMSARGPVVSPRHHALLLTPVAPHQLFDRSLVLGPAEEISIRVVGDLQASVAVDGRRITDLGRGGSVTCVRSESVAGFVRFGTHRYHQVLRDKFGLL